MKWKALTGAERTSYVLKFAVTAPNGETIRIRRRAQTQSEKGASQEVERVRAAILAGTYRKRTSSGVIRPQSVGRIAHPAILLPFSNGCAQIYLQPLQPPEGEGCTLWPSNGSGLQALSRHPPGWQ